MEGERWRRIQELFHEALEAPQAEWRPFLEEACSDETLVADVLAMLEEDARGASLLDRGIADVARTMVGSGTAASTPVDIGPYRITGVLGEGGMGVVYRAERKDVGSVVAIKVLRDTWLSPARRERFAREQQLLAQLKHPGIAQLHDAGALPDGTPWFVMEYVEGLPITEYCRVNAAPIPARLGLFRQTCEAVQYAHRQLVIHRDLKPSNILVTPEGNVKLLDFGISKRLEVAGRPPDETRTGLRLMTPAYAAPEQLRGERPAVDTDVYSLGMILYELLVGHLPFERSDSTLAGTMTSFVEREPEKPSTRAAKSADAGTPAGPSVDKAAWADLDVLTMTAIHKDRARRYRTVEGVIRDVDHYLAGEPLEARPDDLRYRTGKYVRRNRRPLAAAAAVTMAVACLSLFYAFRLTSARNAALAEAARTRRIETFMLSMFEGGDSDAGPKDDLRAVTLVDRGAQEARGLVDEPVVQADLYEALGGMYQKLGNLPAADALLGAALEQRRSLFGGDDPRVAKSLVDVGSLRTDQAQFDAAERLIREGLEKAKRKLPADHPDVARATTALGKVLEERGAYDRAIPVLEEAVRLHSASSPESRALAASLTELANTHFYAGHYDVCRSLNERVLAMDRKLHGDRHPLVASDLINLGAVEAELGRYENAEKLYRQGLEITEAWYGPDHHKTAADLTMLARALTKEGKYAEAGALLRRALTIRERVYGAVHPTVASVLNELGAIALDQERFDDAERYFDRMTGIYRAVYGGDNHYLVATALANLASVYLAKNDLNDAETIFRQAIGIYLKTLPATHPNLGIARVKLGRVLLRQRRYAEAEVESIAGYEILQKQMNLAMSWLQKARQDLADEYEALHEPAQAQKFRAELASTK
jgi:serine/threonine protein kinase/Flp pilus assembly protein TadD